MYSQGTEFERLTFHLVSLYFSNTSNALDTLRPGPGCALLVSRLVIYYWHDLRASGVLAVAIGYIACVWCGYGLDHVASVYRHVRGGLVIRTRVAQLTVMFVSVIS